jgi:hypothetical protein
MELSSQVHTAQERLNRVKKALTSVRAQNWHRFILLTIFMIAATFLVVYIVQNVFTGYRQSEDKYDLVLFGTVTQALTLVTIVSLLAIRRSDLAKADQDELTTIQQKLVDLQKQTEELTKELQDALGVAQVKEASAAKLIETIQADPDAAALLDVSVQEALRKYRQVRDRLDHVTTEIAGLEIAAGALNVTWDRVLFGYLFAAFSFYVSAVPAWYVLRKVNLLQDSAYLAVATVATTAAACSYSLLGRKWTDESKFIQDLKSVNTTVGVLLDIVKPAVESLKGKK